MNIEFFLGGVPFAQDINIFKRAHKRLIQIKYREINADEWNQIYVPDFY